MFQRFTDRARRVVVLAQTEARLLDHNYIGTEHILLGLLGEKDGVAGRALRSLGVSTEGVRQQVEEVIGRGQTPPTGHIPFTPRAKRVLELSLRESMLLGHSYIGTEHLLLGLIREGEGVAAKVLKELGADLEGVRLAVMNTLTTEVSASHATGDEAPGEADPQHGEWEEISVQEEEVIRVRRAEAPHCPACGWPLADTLVFRALEAREAEGEGRRDLVVFYCSRCGRAIGSAPS